MSDAESFPRPRRRKGSGAVTLRDVAKLAGVAPITASRALNTPNQVSAEVRARVTEAVRSTGYVPNLLAGALSSMRSRMVGVAVPTIAGLVFLETVQSLTEALFEAGYQVLLGQTGYDNAREDAWLDAMIGRRPDGLVLTGTSHSPDTRLRLRAAGVPVVETWDQSEDPIDMLVGFSHVEVGRSVADFLVQRGYRRLAGVAGSDERAQRRFRAFQEQAMTQGVPEVPIAKMETPTTLGSGRRGLAELLEAHPDIDAVFCSSDSLAVGVMLEAQARGLRIPQDLAVIGFGDLAMAADMSPSLTTVRIDGTAIGRQAARFIIERAERKSEPVQQRHVDVGFEIIARDST
ncbi:LacI family DNA-binding transcriptional regulator [Roseateles terrae]|uniref:LacI family gluconate utilization system Gnt-I transcriptional repressor n=1 Tax=Roseateles terrae TaxID=431060 RepID=A0ABR6GRZ5_9BURK|nr:LacI family DNA-binding transcriptional regulator [Roseateles terrae]MBB3193903.1 LacI family gluconate utilization system Gnt-I transcriptional repressor [Roseateles terrae]OWQ87784.1 GntR family transcriptional regulator [Roseateles terrae]